MVKIFEYINNLNSTHANYYTVIGFIVTLVGTGLSIVSLAITIKVSRTTKKIRDDLIQNHKKEKFKASKDKIIKDLKVAYNLIKKDEILDDRLIKETLIEINAHKKVLSISTRLNIMIITSTLKNTYLKNKNQKISYQLLNLKNRIRDEIDDYEEDIRRIVK